LTAGISFGLLFPHYNGLALLALFLCMVSIIVKIIGKKSSIFTPLILFFILGYISIQPWFHEKLPPSNIANFADAGTLNISGEVAETPEVINNRLSFILLSESVERDGEVIPVTGKINVKVLNGIPEVSTGDRLYFKSRVRSVRNFKNPGGFDFKRHMAFNGIMGTAYVSWDEIRIERNESHKGFKRYIETARKAFAEFIDNSVPSNEAGVLKALVIGDQNFITAEIRENFNRTGTTHILSISGLHVGIVATVSFLLFEKLLSYINIFLWNAWTKKGAAILSLIPVLIYGLLAGMSPSTQRAVIMVSVFLMSFFVEKEQDGINTLAVAAILILTVYPPSLFFISFQLSFLSVLFILAGMNLTLYGKGKNGGHDESLRLKMQKKTAAFFLVSFFATIGTLPAVMYYFNQVSLVGLAANCVAVPLIGFLVVSTGLLAFFVYPMNGILSAWLLKAGSVVLGVSLEFISYFAKLPFAAVKTVTPSFFEIILYYLLLGTVYIVLRKKQGKKTNDTGGGFFGRMKQKAPFIAVILLVIAGYADIWYWLDKRFLGKNLKVTVIDVGQGASSLLELPGGFNIIVDGGGFSDNSVFDVGEKITAPLLWRKKIKSVDILVLSHPNSDHLNGLLYIAENFNVKEFWSNGEAGDSLGYKRLLEIIKERKIRVRNFKEMERSRVINGVLLKILYPEPGFMDKDEKWRKGDNSSLVLKAVMGSKSFLFTGDIKAKGEEELVRIAGNSLKSTVLVVPHHGSKSSSTDLFVGKIDPEIAVIPVGWKNRYKFPDPGVLERYRSRKCRVFRTDENGAVMISTDGKSLAVEPTLDGIG
jgi:competence protein ComEC